MANNNSEAAVEQKSLGVPTKHQARSLDEARDILQRWLSSQMPQAEQLEVRELKLPSGSGVANETILLDVAWRENGQAREDGYVVRLDTADPLFPGADARRQFDMYRALQGQAGVPLPEVITFEEDPSWLGAPFYLMGRVDGRVPADDPPFHHSGWVTELSTDERAGMWTDWIRVMAKLHETDPDRFGFLDMGDPRQGLRQNLQYYIDRFDTGDTHPILDPAREWLLANFPKNPEPGLSWGDARVGNMIFKNGKCQALLDWDMVSLAGAEADLAWATMFDQSYTVSIGVQRLPGFGTPSEMVARWEQLAGRKVRDWDWHLVFACYRAGVIVRRLARLLAKNGLLPPDGGQLENNNTGIQYVTTLLDLPPADALTTPWPGMDA